MKHGLMTQYPSRITRDGKERLFCCKNIGDYIQSVASKQYVTKIDEYIDQESADRYYPKDKQKCKLIMNGWFQWRTEHWPPSEYIEPLLVSMHFSPLCQEKLLTEKGIAFLKTHEPVGARDLYTQKLLEEHGIRTYFSACVTLTLGKKYGQKNESARKGVFFVDPYWAIPDVGVKSLGRAILAFITHPLLVFNLGRRSFFKEYSPTGFIDKNTSLYRSFYKASLFVATYIKKFTGRLLRRADYVTHWVNVDFSNMSNIDLLNMAENLVQRYGDAVMCITSRIHAGLPCLGMETPVVFIANDEITSESGTWNTPGRLGGLLDFFRLLKIKENYFLTDDPMFQNIKKIDLDTKFQNKESWRSYAQELDNRLSHFMNED